VTDPNRIRSSFEERAARLEKIRQQAETEAHTKGIGAVLNARAAEVTEKSFPMAHSSVASPRTGYYGMPLLKVPAWTWEVPLYFFVGGAAGSAATIAQIGKITGANEKLVNDARWIAAIGGAISPMLLVSDLGRPERFLNMLRVFKIQSAMSVGSWTLVVFSSAAGAAAASGLVEKRMPMFAPLRWAKNAADFTAMIAGLVLCTYTGVLIGATAIPVWHENVGLLPLHFATSGLGTAVSILELRGNDAPALTTLGIAAAATETVVGTAIEINKKRANKPLHKGRSGWMMRAAGLLSGPIPLILRLFAGRSKSPRSVKLRKAAAVSAIAGSLATRIAWIQAGKASAADPSIPLELPITPDEKMPLKSKTALASSAN
jgi:formate-dependent nitrite reductase membrane component NrfD